MTPTLFGIGSAIAAELAFLAYALGGRDVSRLRLFCVVNMMAVGLFAPRLMTVGGWTTNVPSIFFAFVLLGQATIAGRYGLVEARRTTGAIIYGVLLAIVLAAGTLLFPIVSQDPSAKALSVAIDRSIQSVAVSLLAFLVAQLVLLGTLSLRRWWAYPAALILAQSMDSLIFFSLEFASLPPDRLLTMVWHGLVIKLAITAMATPPLLLMLWASRESIDE